MIHPAPVSRVVAGLAFVAALASGAGAQCPDGSTPLNGACRSAPGPARTVPVDPRRVAVLPFRVTTADSLLGEGFAELLAQEFTGEGGPRSVEMSTTLNTWRRSGGGLRSPLTQDSARAVARRLGAGILCEGVITGLGGRLSITATLINSTNAMPMGAPARVSGSVDSVESLLRQVASSLLGVGASERTLKSARLSQNPAALRSYLEGLALWRRGFAQGASRAFEASITADSLFASAIYQRWLMGRAYAGGGIVGNYDWTPRTRERLALLTSRERAVFEAEAGRGQPRTPMGSYTDRRRTAEALGDSPEAWFLAGDQIFHNGVLIVGPDSVLPLARQFFSLALALDTQPVFLFHMTDLAVNTRDTALMRRLLPAYASVEGEDRWIHQWVLANGLGDSAMMESLRRTKPTGRLGAITGNGLMAALNSAMPVNGFEYVIARAAADQQALGTRFQFRVEMTRGRLASAAANPMGAAILSSGTFDVSGDPMDSLLLATVPRTTLPDTLQEARRQCLRARVIIENRGTIALDTDSIRLEPRCRIVLRALDDFNHGTLTDSAVTRLDSVVTRVQFTTFLGFEHRLLARIYESRGDTARAVRAIKLHTYDYGGPWTAPTEREAGRLYLMAKDTARAIASYEHFLALRTEAQPPLIAERDSIKALVSRLKMRLTP